MRKKISSTPETTGMSKGFIFITLLLLTGLFGNSAIQAEAGASWSPGPDDDDVHRFVDEMPEIVGGIEELYSHLTYPDRAVRGGIEGRVVLQFVIDENGQVHNPEILRDIGAGCGEAAIEAVQKVEFTPGRQNGQAVSVLYSLPITFQLQ